MTKRFWRWARVGIETIAPAGAVTLQNGGFLK
jgi:hypothetical protein